MKIQHLQHRHGGRITDLTEIGHVTQDRQAYWFFIGRVEWSDGGVSEHVEISPVCLCRDPDDTAANDELDAAMGALNDYLARNGKWDDMRWKPKARAGKQVLS